QRTSDTYNTFALFGGLPANTLCVSSVAAVGNDGTVTAYADLGSTRTLILPPGLAAPTFASVQTGSVTVAWTDGGNGPGTTYAAEVSTDGFGTVNLSSLTLNLAVVFGSGGAGSALIPNTSYYFQVQSSAGVNTSAFVGLGSTVTLPNQPAGTTVLSVGAGEVNLSWSANGNPDPGTVYEVWRASDAAFSIEVATTQVASPAHTAAGLEASTTYYFRIRTAGRAGSMSAYDAAVSTRTNPPLPQAPGTPAGSGLGVSSISWTWAGARYADSYRVYEFPVSSLLGAPGPTGFDQTVDRNGVKLSTNTSYGIKVSGVNGIGEGALSAAGYAYTLAAPPQGTYAERVYPTSATIRWALNTNPGWTAAALEYSTGSLFAVASTVDVGAVTVSTVTGLLGCTSYYVRVRNRNGAGLATVYDSVVSFLTEGTTPTAPGNLSAESVTGSKVRLTWTPSTYEGVSGYRLYYDAGTGTVDYGSSLAVIPAGQTSYTTDVLVDSDSYKFGLRAAHRCQTLEPNIHVTASAGAAATLAAVRAAVSSPAGGAKIAGGEGGSVGSRVSVTADLTAGAPSDVGAVRFQYKRSDSGVWLDLPSADPALPNPDPSAPYAVSWDVSGLAQTDYDLRAVAADLSGGQDPMPAGVTVSVTPSAQATVSVSYSPATLEVAKTESVDPSFAAEVAAVGVDPSGGTRVVEVVLPAAAFSVAGPVAVTVVPNPAVASLPEVPTTVGSYAGIVSRVSLAGGATLVKSAQVTMNYADADGNGVVDGTSLRVGDARMFSHSGLAGTAWRPLETSVDTQAKTFTGTTPTFSFFAVFATPAADLSRVRVYPNPYKPGSSDPNEGRPFSASNPSSGIVFDNLPTPVTIEIFTVSGQVVDRVYSTSGSGTWQWEVRNANGKDAASGGYFAVISSPGFKRVVKRFVIIR
ncbi:MAG: fibronectin type III domain-containing protein, partial [Elusimicrobia bacterium]|nr:fibronectin type III domain-containing protein [Elusimicrobiota bacterium]